MYDHIVESRDLFLVIGFVVTMPVTADEHHAQSRECLLDLLRVCSRRRSQKKNSRKCQDVPETDAGPGDRRCQPDNLCHVELLDSDARRPCRRLIVEEKAKTYMMVTC